MKLNLAGAKIQDFEPIPAGQYALVVSGGEIKYTNGGPSDKNPTGQYANFELTVDGGEYDGRKLWKVCPLGGDGLGFLKEFLAATGKFEGDLDGDIDWDIEPQLGTKVLANVNRKPRKDNPDEMQNNVTKIRPMSDAPSASGVGSLLP